MNLVLDTGFYLLAAQHGKRSSSYVLALIHAARALSFGLHMSTLAWAECASHVARAVPNRPVLVWQHSDELLFFRRFPDAVTFHHPRTEDLVTAATNLRRVVDPRLDPRSRDLPTFADAVTAALVEALDAEILVTDDKRDFRALLPAFDGEIVSAAGLVRTLGA